ncbi:MAG: choice-of-anchor Q domain-containing protein [Pyrinomonadaceae bacterium]
MKRIVALSLLALAVLICAPLKYTRSASSSSSDRRTPAAVAVAGTLSLNLLFATTLTVDRTDDTAAATACTDAAPNDCSLRGAIIKANADAGADPVIISLQPATTYNLTLANPTQENAAATGDLDITTTAHSVTVEGGGSSGPNATVIDAAGLTSGTSHDRVFQVTGAGVNAVFQDLVIRNGKAADDGTGGASTNPNAQNANRAGGGILDNGGSVTLTDVTVESCQALGKGDTVVNDHTTLDAHGGAIASVAPTGTVVVTNSTLSNDSATGGDGGIFNNGAGSGAQGGSIYFAGGTLDIQGSRIENSAATGGKGGDQDQNGQTNGGFGGIAQGGGVWIGGGTATINNTTFENTTASGGDSGTGGNGSEPAGGADGGGIYSLGSLTITNSTFHLAGAVGGDSGNTFGSTCLGGHTSGDAGGARGGAIFADGGSLIADTSTFANNSAVGGKGGDGGQTNGGLNCGAHGTGGLAYGGAIANNSATVNIKHATISGNNAQAGNSGVNQGGANKPAQPAAEGAGGGVRVGAGGVTVENTIIAGNTAANGIGNTTGAPTPGPNVDGSVTSNGHNLLGVATDATGFTGAGDQTGANPSLAALADNGGTTQTMALQPGSPAIDAGVAAGASFDQRGMARTVDDPGVTNTGASDGTDIGAFEAAPSCHLSCLADFSVSNDTDSCGALVSYAAPSGSACGTVTCDHPSGSFFPIGDTTVTCTSSAGPSCAFKITVNDTQNPTISAPADASYQCAAQVPTASPSQATASDNCAAPTVTVSDSDDGGAGSTASPLIITRTYTATDAAGHTASASQTITVVDNTAPSVTPPANDNADADASTCAASVNPDTATASDNCSGAVAVVGTRGDSQPLNAPYPVGTTTITWTATDAHGNSASAAQTVTVTDAQAPTVTNLSASPSSLWSPNHTMRNVTVTYNASDNCGGVNCRIGSVTSNEPANGTGDGNTAPDWVIVDSHHVQLRAERAGGGAGRTYTITVVCTDGSNNMTTKSVTVTVPKSQK